MTKILQVLIFELFAMLCFTAHAGNSAGQITQVVVSDDVVLFTAGPHLNKPACSYQGDAWAISLSTPGGRATYALVLSAQAQHLSVDVFGYASAVCSAWGDRETARTIQLIP